MKMPKLNLGAKKDDILNMRVKSQLNEKTIKKIRETLLFLTDMDIKTSTSCNVIVIKKDENENKMVVPTIILQRNYNEGFERINQNEINIENDIDFDQSELADSSDFENEEDDF